MQQKNIVLLGSTGSIGKSAGHVIRHLQPHVRVRGVVARSNVALLAEQAREWGCDWACTTDPHRLSELRQNTPANCDTFCDQEQLCERVADETVDSVLCAIVGTTALHPVLAALRAGHDVALATKEILVLAGAIVTAEARRHGARILPVDSEHSAIFQCIDRRPETEVRRLILTASGGPFLNRSAEELATVNIDDALAHPTWRMGPKVTIDSATLMNKGLELIEAHWLFGKPEDKIDVVIHPQSIVHSMIEFVDGSILAQLGEPDMCLPIHVALTWPERAPGGLEPFDFTRDRTLTFFAADCKRFPALGLARAALSAGGTMPAVFNAANEHAVSRFCNGLLPFNGIVKWTERVMEQHVPVRDPNLQDILAADDWARHTTL